MSKSAFMRRAASQEAELALIEAAWGMTAQEIYRVFDEVENI